MALREADTNNFETLVRAIRNDDVALVQTTDKATGEYRAVLAIVEFDGDEVQLTPVACMAWDDPMELWGDPTDDDVDVVEHLECVYCGLDIEGVNNEDWRDRGNNRLCPSGVPHEPYRG